jgi:hypothetical protein
MYTGGSILGGIKKGLFKVCIGCTYGSMAVCYISVRIMVHPKHITPTPVAVGNGSTFPSLSER